ncbi:MAG: lysophospholipid acyltransferase family protein [Deltaproteobacteria bacterium]|nr:lysophospholipid acyltransferase family protein [Deltaproteobacteria bacterium]MBI3388833.1 lysophospholipid acyltransferase family protein [Deltaproteobacteria bacterium]
MFATWRRRIVSIPFYLGLCVVLLAAFPLLIIPLAVVDLARGSPWVLVRCLSFATFYLCCEVIGIVVSFAFWLAQLVSAVRDRGRYLARHLALQRWWARTLYWGAERIFSMRTEVEGDADIGDGPIILFIRHASMGDTLLPAVILSDRHGYALRYVLKRELLWDPCLDVVGNRLPNYFVRRGSGESAHEIAEVRRLMEHLGAREGVLIYPEGTRFTAAKHDRAIARLEQSGQTELAARARTFRNILPPRLGGPLALLEGNQNADAVFCAHVGFEGAATIGALLSGSLVGQVIRVRFWRVPFAAIPRDRAAQITWLYDQWARVDAFVRRHARCLSSVSAVAPRRETDVDADADREKRPPP